MPLVYVLCTPVCLFVLILYIPFFAYQEKKTCRMEIEQLKNILRKCKAWVDVFLILEFLWGSILINSYLPFFFFFKGRIKVYFLKLQKQLKLAFSYVHCLCWIVYHKIQTQCIMYKYYFSWDVMYAWLFIFVIVATYQILFYFLFFIFYFLLL